MRTLFLLLTPFLLFAQLTLEDLKQAPKGHVRNFNIWQFMAQDISAKDADEAYSLVDKYNHKVYLRYVKKTKDEKVLQEYRCTKLKIKELMLEEDASCVNLALSYSRAFSLKDTQRVLLADTLKDQYKTKSDILLVMNEDKFIQALLKSGSKNYLKLFNGLGYKIRHKYFNIKLSSDIVNKLANERAFNQAIKYIVTDKKMGRMQKSILSLKPHELNDISYFFLALNALKFKATTKAMTYLSLAEKKAYYQIHKDKSVFWMYQITKDKKFLQQLSASTDINIYTLYANEKLNIEVKNYFSDLNLTNAVSKVNLSNPYVWEKVLDEIRAANKDETQKLLKKYNSKDDMALNAFIYAKSTKYHKHNYIMPYAKVTNDLSNDDKAILYSLAKQESQFIPSALSRSYALGVMQMMPFLVKALAKGQKEKVSLNSMFDPYKNITYSKKHLKWLKKNVYHPLFIAYAYNGGLGFTTRHLKTGTFTKGSYEPFLSMELMSNTESREYGKKVLANYIIYKKILGEEVKISSLFKSLTNPLKTDKMRAEHL